MFNNASYDIIQYSPPTQGMNQNVSPDILTNNFAFYLENYFAQQLGELAVRFGTRKIFSLPNIENKIIKAFNFTKPDGNKQLILYVQEYVNDDEAQNILPLPDNRQGITFSSNNLKYYEDNIPIKIVYTLNGQNIVYDTIKSCIKVDEVINLEIANNYLPPVSSNPQITNIYYAKSNIYCLDMTTFSLSLIGEDFSLKGIPRSARHLNKLFICNGIDKIVSWDGENLDTVCDFVKQDDLTSITRTNNTMLTLIGPRNLINPENYEIGNSLRIRNNGTTQVFEITQRQATIVANNIFIVLTVNDDLPEFNNKTEVFYQAFPPPFNYLFSCHNRLWALGPGAASIKPRSNDQALRLYFMYRSDSYEDWFNEKTQGVPYIDLSLNHEIEDNLEAIAFINGNMVFMGRERTQIWSGSDPKGAMPGDQNQPLSYVCTLKTGVVHGDLVLNMPNDIAFFSKTGYQTLGSLNIAKQFAITSFNSVDPLIKENIKYIMSSDVNYWACQSFKYDSGSLAGFKMGKANNVLSSLFSTSLYAWTVLSGDFSKAQCFSVFDNNLYLCINNQIYTYADGNDGTNKIYADNDGNSPIPFRIIFPKTNLKGKRFFCKRIEIEMDYPSSFLLDKSNKLSLSIDGDLPKSFTIEKNIRLDKKGDLLGPYGTVPLSSSENDSPSSLGFRLGIPYVLYKDRLKFIASKFWLRINGFTKYGPINLKNIKLYGIFER